jgi:phosphoserine phosphatase RsbU/P
MDRRRTCALLIDFYGGDYQLGIVQGAEEKAITNDNNLIIAVGRWLNAPRRFELIQNDVYHHLRSPGTDAVVVASGCLSHYVSPAQMADFCAQFAPLPVASISVRVPGVPSLVVDNRNGQKLAIDHLIEAHNCRRIAYLRGPTTSFEASERFDGYRESLQNHQIAFDPDLVFNGNFWFDSGRECAQQLLDRGMKFDALVGANDYMALGAFYLFKERGIRIPRDVRLAGFDDVPAARMASPSLTTVRQPLQRMGALAVDLLGQKLDGKFVDEVYSLEVEFVRRQSCGCGRDMDSATVPHLSSDSSRPSSVDLATAIEDIQDRILDAICIHSDRWPRFVETLLSALHSELSGKQGAFLRVLAELLEEVHERVELLDQFYNIIGAVRAELRSRCVDVRLLENLCHAAVVYVGECINRSQMRTLFEQNVANNRLRESIERLSTALTRTALSEALDAFLPTTAIRSACLGLYEGSKSEQLHALSVIGSPNAAELHGCVYDAADFAPHGFLPTDRRYSFVLIPLSHSDSLYGQALLEVGDQHAVYFTLREQIGAALKATDLHRAVIDETSRRERAERAGLERETAIAQEIQTAILPDRFDVPGLRFAATMRPAATVGGDYYDVIPIEDGCFIGIGDVTGHGLFAGMIMLMVQSMITVAVHTNPNRSPSQLLPPINRALFNNIRHRLHGTDHVTLTLIRYQRDGKLIFAGAHDDPLIWRRSTAKCERICPNGFWLAAIADIAPLTSDVAVQLYDGDVLVLYTDGITEAMNASHEQFGLERLIAVVERHGADSPEDLNLAVLRALSNWSNLQIDDISLLIAKYDACALPGA